MFCQSPFCKHNMRLPSANGRERRCAHPQNERAQSATAPSGISRGGRTASRTSCRPTKGRFPPSAESLGTRDDRFGQPKAGKSLLIFNHCPADQGCNSCSVPRRQVRRRNRMRGWGLGVWVRQETSSVSPQSNSGPVPLRRGFSLESSESPLLSVLGSLATALRYLDLEDFREGGTTRDLPVFHYL